jgi:hypothetical protein
VTPPGDNFLRRPRPISFSLVSSGDKSFINPERDPQIVCSFFNRRRFGDPAQSLYRRTIL